MNQDIDIQTHDIHSFREGLDELAGHYKEVLRSTVMSLAAAIREWVVVKQ